MLISAALLAERLRHGQRDHVPLQNSILLVEMPPEIRLPLFVQRLHAFLRLVGIVVEFQRLKAKPPMPRIISVSALKLFWPVQ